MLCLLLLLSCSSNRNNQITVQNIQEFCSHLENDKNLSDLQVDFFRQLNAIAKGRESYKNLLSSQSTHPKPQEFEHILINEKDFEYISQRIFTVLLDNNITYGKLLADLQASDSLNNLFTNELIMVYGQIDSVCKELDHSMPETHEPYISPSILYGFCPYMPDNHPLYIKAESIRNKRNSEIEYRFPILSKVRKMMGELFVGIS